MRAMRDKGVNKLFDQDQIADQVRKLAQRISRDYQGGEVVLVGCLTGAFVFMADLMRGLDIPVTCDFIKVSSYEDRMTPGELILQLDVTRPLQDQHVIVVEDIVDTGQTLTFIREHLWSKKPASVDLCVLLYKESERATLPKDQIRYLGFTVPDEFIVGYGIDYAHRHRELNYIGSVTKA